MEPNIIFTFFCHLLPEFSTTSNDLDMKNNYKNTKVEEMNKYEDVKCEFCKKSFIQKTILRHIGQTTLCKEYYGPRFTQMKKDQAKKRLDKYRQNIGNCSKEHMKKLKRNRKLYSKNEELKEKKRQYYQENKERIREKNAKFSKYCLYSHKKKKLRNCQ